MENRSICSTLKIRNNVYLSLPFSITGLFAFVSSDKMIFIVGVGPDDDKVSYLISITLQDSALLQCTAFTARHFNNKAKENFVVYMHRILLLCSMYLFD